MSELGDAVAALERAITRLETAAGRARNGEDTPSQHALAAAQQAEAVRIQEVAAELVARVDTALDKLGRALESGG